MTNRNSLSALLAGFGRAAARFARARWRRLLLLFGGVLLPMLLFGDLAEDVWAGGGFAWDVPVLRGAHALATPALDWWMLFVSALGYAYGVVPGAAGVFVLLLFLRRRGDALFFLAATGGAGLLNRGAKLLFRRDRPALWESVAPEHSYSFPSGHAMGSMALAAALAVLAWPTRWRWWAIAAGGAFTLVVGASRVYLGVHYPSDVLAGWMASLAWVLGVSQLAYGRPGKRRDAQTPAGAGRDPEAPHPQPLSRSAG